VRRRATPGRRLVLVAASLPLVGTGVLGLGTGCAAAARGAPAVLVAVTTTSVGPTTTTTPPTTTTMPPTTTSSTTTTSSSTTTSSTTTTTAPLVATTTSSSTPWGLIIAVVVLVLAIVLVILLLAARRRRGVEEAWRKAVVPALSDAQLARESLLSDNAVSGDAEVRAAVTVQVDRAASALDHTAASAPDSEAGSMARTAAEALRGLGFAIEADRLLRHGTASPTGTQLAEADAARRARSGELTAALVRLSTRIGSPPR
jgi:Subtelomeric Variable Open Reading frame